MYDHEFQEMKDELSEIRASLRRHYDRVDHLAERVDERRQEEREKREEKQKENPTKEDLMRLKIKAMPHHMLVNLVLDQHKIIQRERSKNETQAGSETARRVQAETHLATAKDTIAVLERTLKHYREGDL